jgi:hypothetical protein
MFPKAMGTSGDASEPPQAIVRTTSPSRPPAAAMHFNHGARDGFAVPVWDLPQWQTSRSGASGCGSSGHKKSRRALVRRNVVKQQEQSPGGSLEGARSFAG